MCRLKSEGIRCQWWVLLGLGLAVGLVAVTGSGEGKAFGSLTTRVTMTPLTVAAESGFQASYFAGLVAELPSSTLSSIPGLAGNTLVSTGSGLQVVLPSPAGTSFVQFFAYHKEDIVLDWPVGVWGLVSELAFSWDTRRHYVWSHAWVHYAGVELWLRMTVARSDAAAGSGMELGFSGTTLRGLALSIVSQYGLATDRTALLRAVSLGQVSGEMLEYRATTLTAGVFPLCCLSLAAAVELTKAGFGSARISTAYTFTLAKAWITASASLVFRSAEKTLKVTPRLTLPGTGTEIYFSYSLIPARLSSSSPSLTGIQLDEVGLSRVQIGEITVSGRYSLSGSVYRGPLTVPYPFDLLLSFGRSTWETDLWFDMYFASDGAYLFGLGLITFQAGMTLFGDFRIGIGFDVTTDTGWRRLVGELMYTFNLYGL